LELIINNSTSSTLNEFIKEHVFSKLNMKSQFNDDIRRIIKNRAKGYTAHQYEGFQTLDVPLNHGGDGALMINLEDFFEYDKNFFKNKLGLHPERLIHEILRKGQLNNGEVINYGFGLRLNNYKGYNVVEHSGRW
jgi:hypothetical protein